MSDDKYADHDAAQEKDMDAEVEEVLMAEEEQEQPIARYKKDDYTFKVWERKIEEEEARWRHLGINLNQLTYAGSEIFAMQCKLQALTNIILEGDMSEENMNLHLKMIIMTNLENIRENIEPQIAQAKLMQGVHPPQIVFPWMRKDGGGNGG